MKIRYISFLLAVCFVQASFAQEGPIPVSVAKTQDGYTLVRAGQPYFVRGAGTAGIDLVTVKERGGNSIRTWGIETAQETLDEAHQHGLTVAMGLPVAAERFGFDYDSDDEKQLQRDNVFNAVRKYKDHPALLFWILGNELDMLHTNPRVYNEINVLSEGIKEIDPNHPTTTTISALDKETVELVRDRAPSLDFVSLQAYGALALMPKAIEYLQHGPFMITEWGPLGHWEVGKTRWDAPIELNSTEKGRHYLKFYLDFIAPYTDQALGSYAFLWGQKQERTHTWFSLFMETGESTTAVDILQFVWTGKAPANQSPTLESMVLARRDAHDSVRLSAGKEYSAKVKAIDPDGDPLSYSWSVKPESEETVVGGDLEADILDLDGLIIGETNSPSIKVKAPNQPGPYRLFVNIDDGLGHAAHANIPFMVIGKKR